mmetsp:Transcript_102127/g.288420  ORF Transcript_102127/g.288420 Transcript_102127/m.288420 type:complete len:509 (-) Transcript_102127:326-1852(-)
MPFSTEDIRLAAAIPRPPPVRRPRGDTTERRTLQTLCLAFEGAAWHVVCAIVSGGRFAFSAMQSSISPLPGPFTVHTSARAVIMVCRLKQWLVGQAYISTLQNEMLDPRPIIALLVPEGDCTEEYVEAASALRMDGVSETILQRTTGRSLRLDVELAVQRAYFADEDITAQVAARVVDRENKTFWPSAHMLFHGFPSLDISCITVPVPGATIGHSDLVRIIGQGAITKVYLATNFKTIAREAFRVVPKIKLIDLRSVSRLNDEILVLRRLEHPNVVRLKSVMHARYHIYFIMEFAGDENLLHYYQHLPRACLSFAKEFMEQISGGVAYLHRAGIAHRNLAPENIAVRQPRRWQRATAHFTIVGFGDAMPTTKPCSGVAGSTYLCPPEANSGEPYMPAPADMWSLGAMLLELTCGTDAIHVMLETVASSQEGLSIESQIFSFFGDSNNVQFHIEANLNCDDALITLLIGLLAIPPEERWTANASATSSWLQSGDRLLFNTSNESPASSI